MFLQFVLYFAPVDHYKSGQFSVQNGERKREREKREHMQTWDITRDPCSRYPDTRHESVFCLLLDYALRNTLNTLLNSWNQRLSSGDRYASNDKLPPRWTFHGSILFIPTMAIFYWLLPNKGSQIWVWKSPDVCSAWVGLAVHTHSLSLAHTCRLTDTDRQTTAIKFNGKH